MNKVELIEFCSEKLSTVEREFDTEDNIFEHSIRVAKIIDELMKDEKLTVCAMFHDILEDSNATKDDLKLLGLSDKMISTIDEVTNCEKTLDEIGRTHYMTNKISDMSDEALFIKMADRIDNLSLAFELYNKPFYELRKHDIDRFVSWYAGETLNLMYSALEERMGDIAEEIDEIQDEYTRNLWMAMSILYQKLIKLITEERY